MGHKDQDQELRAVPSLRNLVQDVSLALVNTKSGHRQNRTKVALTTPRFRVLV